ncbi:type II secretion system protein GspC [Photobacterium damselae]|uniref:type II secretion system protein GspC n=1 Tax=Photobacterium damselae TaxID=38293 RepID=UPI001EFEAEEA|nr:type II secretion system protein GspC [Photobacterium damselae]MCG9705309.1 type II secretion system protein GspC [Photobacterium damselae]
MVVFKQLNQFKMHSPMPIAKVAQIVTLLLVIWFGWILGRLLWTVIQPTETVTSWQPSQTQSVGQQQKFPVADLIAMNLFGLYQQSAQPVATPVKQDAPETRLNLTLNGVVASSNPEKALAIITNQGKQNTYGLNEAIKGTRATLQAVYADRVIIRNSGSDETLMLDGVKFSKTSTATQPTAPVTTQSSSSSGELEKIKAEIMKNPQNLFSYIRLSQVKNDGKLMGYRVNPGKNKILFDEVGLEPNDLAVTLNGNDLTDPTVMTKLWSELSQASSFTLGVDRDGQLHDIYIELQ